MELRDYQQRAIDGIREEFRKGNRRVLLHMATGGGKTVCFSKMMIDSMQKGVRSLMVVRGRKLVDQASQRLFRESVHHGVLMAGHWNRRPQAPIQICSIDTMHSKAKNESWVPPEASLLIIDEVHMATSEAFKKFLKRYPDAFVVGVTATPYTDQPLRHVAQAIVHPITMKELIEQGFLVKPRYFTSGKRVDLTGVKSARGDYVQSQLAAAMDRSTITGDIVSHYTDIGEGRPALCFAVNVAHSCHIVAQFRAAGIPAEHCDADTPEIERESIIKRLQQGELKVVSNVGIFCTGIDIPAVSCIIMARPTKSYNLYVQQIGRGTRTYSGKSDFLVLDHAGNVPRHGCVLDEPEANLDGKAPKKEPTNITTCTECYAIYLKALGSCPECGFTPPVQSGAGRGGPVFVDGQLSEWKPEFQPETDEDVAESFCESRLVRYNNASISTWKAFYDTQDRFGKDIARAVFFRCCKRLNISPPKPGRNNSGST